MTTTEDILRELFEQLPDVKDSNDNLFKVKFNWGNQDDLNLFLSQFKSTTKYPLIWLVDGEDNIDLYSTEINRKARLIIAKQSIHQTNTNPIVWDSEFRDVLNPLLENVLKCLNESGKTMIKNGIHKIKRDANYSDKSAISATIDPWNIIILDFDLVIFTYQCFHTIKFN